MASALSALFLFVLKLRTARRYRPELHYMRGPKCPTDPGACG